MLIAVEGPDGAGKTTLCNNLYRGFTEYRRTCSVIRSPYDFVDADCIISEITKTHNMRKITVMLLFCWYSNQIAERVRLADKNNDYVFLDRYYMSNYMYNCFVHNEQSENLDGFAFNYSEKNIETMKMIKRLQDKSVNVLGQAICTLAMIAESAIVYDVVKMFRPSTFSFKYDEKVYNTIFGYSGFYDKNINDRIAELARQMDWFYNECIDIKEFKRIALNVINGNIAYTEPDLYIIIKNPIVHKEDNVYVASFDQVVKNYNDDDLIRQIYSDERIVVDNIEKLDRDMLNRAIGI